MPSRTPRANIIGKPSGRPPKRKATPMTEKQITGAHHDAEIAEVSGIPFDPPYEAYKLRLTGLPWTEVAHRTGYASDATVVRAVSIYLQKAALRVSQEHQQEALQMSIGRYEAVLAEWWELGTTGHDEKAAAIVLRTLERLDRVQRLTEGDAQITTETIVISGDPDSYVKQLQAVAEGRKTAS